MIEIEEALRRIESFGFRLPKRAVPLAEAVGYHLAEPAMSDVDSPPFDKSMMDGFAIQSSDVSDGKADLEIVERVMAGQMPERETAPGQATQIMTGAPLPPQADAVVMVEETREYEREGKPRVAIEANAVRQHQNILPQAATLAIGDQVMPVGQMLRCEDVGPLAEAGCATCHVFSRPRLAVIATGDELVSHETAPAASQIRNSNGPMLTAMAQRNCQEVTDLGIGRDDRDALRDLIQQGLTHDVLVLSGGVSAGKLDLVPSLLQEAGVKQVFHKVKIKPGKPVWFGVLDTDSPSNQKTFVFGLPGNPVSSMVCYHIFVAPLLRYLAGDVFQVPHVQAQLTSFHSQRPGRTTYWPSRLTVTETGWQAEPLAWKGSADLKTLIQANGFIVMPAEQAEFPAGTRVAAFLIP